MSLGLIGDSIPPEWPRPLLTDLVTPKQWKTISTKELLDDGYVIYGANGKIGFYSEYTHEKPTLMITCRGATCGNLHISEPFSYINGNAMALDDQPTELVGLSFLYHVLLARSLTDTISGSAQPQITRQGLSVVRVPLPPLAEQKIIADKLDTLLAQVESTKARLERIPLILKRFRQSVLAAAVSGKLTEEWRSSGRSLDPKAFVLKDNHDREKIFESTQNHEIPANWKWLRLIDTGRITGGGTPSKSERSYWDGDIQWITPKDMKVRKIDSSKLTITDLGVSNSSVKIINKDSVLFVTRGMILAHSFPVAVNKRDVTVNQDMKAITPYQGISCQYLLISLEAKKAIFVQLAGSSTHGTKRLESKHFSNVAIPIPPLEEQTEIVRRVEQLFAYADTIEQQVQNALARVNNLTPSILAKAFRGELTEQWRKDNPDLISGDNSAEALLEKIKAEREATRKHRMRVTCQ